MDINEIKKDVLLRYIEKAKKSSDFHLDSIKSGDDKSKRHFSKLVDREKGIQSATQRIAAQAIEDALFQKPKIKGPSATLSSVKEEFPTNSMGASSSTAGTGPIDTFDPILGVKKRILKRKKPNFPLDDKGGVK